MPCHAAYLDELSALEDPEFFTNRLKAEVISHMNILRARELKDPAKKTTYEMTTLSSQFVYLTPCRGSR